MQFRLFYINKLLFVLINHCVITIIDIPFILIFHAFSAGKCNYYILMYKKSSRYGQKLTTFLMHYIVHTMRTCVPLKYIYMQVVDILVTQISVKVIVQSIFIRQLFRIVRFRHKARTTTRTQHICYLLVTCCQFLLVSYSKT